MKLRKSITAFSTVICLAIAPIIIAAQDFANETPLVAASVTPTATPIPTETPVTPVIPEKELRVNGNKLSFYVKGSMLKDSWQNYNGFRYYFGSNGYAYKGTHRIGEKVYVFNENGHLLRNQKNKMVTVSGQKYYIISKSGNPATGYFVYKNNLYYADSRGRCYQNRSRENGQLYFTSSGAAKKNTNALLKMKVMQTVSSITNSKMNQSQKLRACWNYITDWSKFNYGGEDPDRSKKGWYRETALKMLSSRTGNCYSFACAFAAMAKEVGYKNITVILGYDHCWVTINGKHYDPQAHWSGWIRNIYGLNEYPSGSDGVTVCDFMK